MTRRDPCMVCREWVCDDDPMCNECGESICMQDSLDGYTNCASEDEQKRYNAYEESINEFEKHYETCKNTCSECKDYNEIFFVCDRCMYNEKINNGIISLKEYLINLKDSYKHDKQISNIIEIILEKIKCL